MQVLTLLNEKGGVGKTTLATHIAAGLALRGNKVIIIDADAQGHATIRLGIAKRGGFYDLLVREEEWQSVLSVISPDIYVPEGAKQTGSLFLLPSNIETRNIATTIDDPELLRERLDELRGSIDYVIFDTSPTPSLLHGSIYMATDAILYPTTLEPLAFDGLLESIRHRERAIKQRGQDIRILGIIPTMVREKTAIHRHNLDDLHQTFGKLVWPPIKLRTAWVDATQTGQMVWVYEPSGYATQEALTVVNNLVKVNYGT